MIVCIVFMNIRRTHSSRCACLWLAWLICMVVLVEVHIQHTRCTSWDWFLAWAPVDRCKVHTHQARTEV